MLIALNMHLVILKLLTFPLKLPKLALVLHPNEPLLLFESGLELRCVLDFLSTHQHLRSQRLDLLLKRHLLGFLVFVLLGSFLEEKDRGLAVLLEPLFLLFHSEQFAFVDDVLVFGLQLGS